MAERILQWPKIMQRVRNGKSKYDAVLDGNIYRIQPNEFGPLTLASLRSSLTIRGKQRGFSTVHVCIETKEPLTLVVQAVKD